jgi:DNA-binding NtrC family response regulator
MAPGKNYWPAVCSQANPMDLRPASLHEAVNTFKRQFILDALSSFDGNRSRAAAALGIERTSLLRLIRDLRIDEAPRGRRGRPSSAVPRPHVRENVPEMSH